jgi:hypothetical protein
MATTKTRSIHAEGLATSTTIAGWYVKNMIPPLAVIRPQQGQCAFHASRRSWHRRLARRSPRHARRECPGGLSPAPEGDPRLAGGLPTSAIGVEARKGVGPRFYIDAGRTKGSGTTGAFCLPHSSASGELISLMRSFQSEHRRTLELLFRK